MKKNISIIFLANFFTLLSGVVTSLLTAWALGAEGRGDLAVVVLYPNVVALALGLGLAQANRFFLADEPQAVSPIFSNSLIFVAVMGVIACKNDRKTALPFVGHWSLTYGEINGRPAPSLENIYFEFGIDSLKTNFTQSEQEESGSFDVDEHRIIQNTIERIEYDVEEMTDSTLEMTTALRGLDFKLFLKKEGQ